MLFVLPFPTIDPVLIEFGPLAIRWYSLAYIGGIFLGWLYLRKLLGQEHLWAEKAPPRAPIDRQGLDDLLVWAAFGIILGGRIGYVLFYDFARFLDDPTSIFAVWQGGMSFHGGFAGTILAIFVFAKKNKMSPLAIGDLVAVAAPIGLFFGRLANFINAELYGRVSDVPWAMVFPGGGPEPRHPSQLYEAALEGLVLFVLLRIATHKYFALQRPGFVIGLFFCLYGLFRFAIEFVRLPDAHIGFLTGGLTMGMALSLPMIPIGLAIIAFSRRPSPASQ